MTAYHVLCTEVYDKQVGSPSAQGVNKQLLYSCGLSCHPLEEKHPRV